MVQTFLPYPEFAASAAVLDERRLGKQRVEALQVVRALTRQSYGWKRHPAVRMWDGFVEALAAYGLEMCAQWRLAGNGDTCAAKIVADLAAVGMGPPRPQVELSAAGALPGWLGDDRLHRSHRAALVRKDPARYAPLFPDVDPAMPYFWPL